MRACSAGNSSSHNDVRDRKLVVNEAESDLVRLVFNRFLRVGSAATLAQELRRAGHNVATDAIRQGYADCPVRSVPAAEVEEAVVAQVRHLLRSPEIIARTWAAAKREGDEAIHERDVVKRITELAPLWDWPAAPRAPFERFDGAERSASG